ncbi:MAG: sel1 repeat family protein [Lachnospiraceae bacterium]|nr:sel1 repeat family protein [Lachnospiraceae bacterium]
MAAEKNNSAAMRFLVNSYIIQGQRAFSQNNFAEAAKWYKMAADTGDLNALCFLGNCYYSMMKFTEAVKCFRMAGRKGNANAQFFMGICYLEGNGVTKDEKVAVVWLRKAADQGDKAAKELLDKLPKRLTRKRLFGIF